MPSYLPVKSNVSRRIASGLGNAQSRFEAKPPRVARVFRGVSVANEQFRRNAASVRASSAKGTAFHEGDIHPGRAAFDGS